MTAPIKPMTSPTPCLDVERADGDEAEAAHRAGEEDREDEELCVGRIGLDQAWVVWCLEGSD